MKNNLEIGSRIRKLREELHMNRNMFSEQINISETYLSQIERGEKGISLNVVYSVASFTNCSTDYLLYGNTDENNSKRKRLIRLINRSNDKDLDMFYDVLRAIKSHSNNYTNIT